jgi:hypothetical protein
MKAQTPYRTVVSNLSQLSRDELDDVAAMIAGLLAARAAEESAAESVQPLGGPISHSRRRGPGYYEVKTIHGRQYKYLRYWSGTAHKSTYKSVYIGKVE